MGSHAPVEVGSGVVLNFGMDEHQGAGLKDEGLRESGGIGANRPPPGSGPRARGCGSGGRKTGTGKMMAILGGPWAREGEAVLRPLPGSGLAHRWEGIRAPHIQEECEVVGRSVCWSRGRAVGTHIEPISDKAGPS